MKIHFNCPHCNALHNVVRKEAGAAMVTRQATCRACGGPIPSREGKFALRYLLLRTAIKIDPTAPEHQHRSLPAWRASPSRVYDKRRMTRQSTN